MKEYYSNILLLLLFAIVIIFYEVKRKLNKENTLMKMSYDNKRFFMSLPFLFNILLDIKYFVDQSQYVSSIREANLVSLEEFTVFMKELNFDTAVSIGTTLLIIVIFIIYDYRIFGVINRKGLQLHKFIKFKKILSYSVDKEFSYIELCYQSIFNKTKYRYIKADIHEVNQISTLLSTYVRQNNYTNGDRVLDNA